MAKSKYKMTNRQTLVLSGLFDVYLRSLVVSFVLCMLLDGASAADIFITEDKSRTYRIQVSGNIIDGDSEKFKKIVQSNTHKVLLGVILDSRGGSVRESIRLANMVELLDISTRVAPQSNCSSACFFIWLAGQPRQANSRENSRWAGRIGLHRPFLTNPSSADNSIAAQREIQAEVRKYLHERDVSNSIIDIMMSRASNEIYWLNDRDLSEIGEYSHSIQELLISKCNYDKNLVDKILDAREQRRTKEEQSLLARQEREDECTTEIRFDRLKSGILKFLNKFPPQEEISRSRDGEEEALVARIYPDWKQIVRGRPFSEWLSVQDESVKSLAKSERAIDAIKLLDLFKNRLK